MLRRVCNSGTAGSIMQLFFKRREEAEYEETEWLDLNKLITLIICIGSGGVKIKTLDHGVLLK